MYVFVCPFVYDIDLSQFLQTVSLVDYAVKAKRNLLLPFKVRLGIMWSLENLSEYTDIWGNRKLMNELVP